MVSDCDEIDWLVGAKLSVSYNHLGNNDCMKLSAQPIIPKAASSPAVMYFEPSEHPNRLHSSR